jgi:FlaA1/EpsC-like NDP-sugar epimerase
MRLTRSQRVLEQTGRALMSCHLRLRRPAILVGAGLAAFAAVSAIPSPPAGEHAAFIAENDAAMDKMMKGMHVMPSGDVDRDFAVMMTAHHQGAVDMALAQLRYGRNERLKRLASEIIVEQRQEIALMQQVLSDELWAPVCTTAGLP